VREWAAENFADEHAGQKNIRDELGIAGDLLEPLDSLDPLSDDGELFSLSHDWCARWCFGFSPAKAQSSQR
jgi:hypothetical protein